MSSVISETIDGIGTVPVQAEYTDASVLQDYANALALIVNVYKKNPATDPLTSQDVIDVRTGLAQLDALATDGKVVEGKQHFITLEMARSINLLKRSFETAVFDPNATDTEQMNAIKRWQDLSEIGLANIIDKAIGTLSTNRSVQAIIELEYVRAGNEQIFAALSQLQKANAGTKGALDLLNEAQRLHNMLSPENNNVNRDAVSRWEAGAVRDFCTVGDVVEEFRSAFDPMFSQPLYPRIDEDLQAAGFQGLTQETQTEFTELRIKLQSTVEQLDQINGTYAGGPNEANRAGTLPDRLEQVLKDMGSGLGGWILDNYNVSGNNAAGNFQRRLTDAITTAQSINDQQRQDLRQQLFLFEQFYRSSNSMLQIISRIIQEMASKISR